MAVGIVGGSVAGLSTAISILELDANTKVAVYERKNEFGEPCGGAIGIYKYNLVGETFKRIILWSTLSPIFNVQVFAPDGSSWQITSSNPIGFLVDRGKLESLMYEKVQEYGGKVYTGVNVKGVYADGIKVNGHVVLYDYVVDARGLQPPFPDACDMHHCVQIEMPTPYLDKGSVILYFGEKIAPKGYAWIFTIQEGLSKIGLGVPLSLKINPARLLEKFVKNHSDLDYNLFKNIVGRSLQSKVIPTAKAGPLIEDGVFRVGDRALLCDPSTVLGIANAILSGYACAKSIVTGKPEKFKEYAKNIISENMLRYKIKNFITSLNDSELSALIKSLERWRPRFRSIKYDIGEMFARIMLVEPKVFLRALNNIIR